MWAWGSRGVSVLGLCVFACVSPRVNGTPGGAVARSPLLSRRHGAAAPSRPEATREQRRPQAGSVAQPMFRTEGRPSKGSEHHSSVWPPSMRWSNVAELQVDLRLHHHPEPDCICSHLELTTCSN
ncbi:uncharacterized protein LOC135579593 isoform X1 [Columba livia]|uniref:uncharacterized protein LOC135579593 isoform X1 n=1 Tax=Columba livia TaxID=8932 RepID=UPI0031B9BD7E